jgi:PRTRC genetic system protein E
MFTALHALAKQATLMITIAAEGDDQLRVNVTPMPFDDKAKSQLPKPLSLLATPTEFDADFIAALATWQAPKRSLVEQAQDSTGTDEPAAPAAPASKAAAKQDKPSRKTTARGGKASASEPEPAGVQAAGDAAGEAAAAADQAMAGNEQPGPVEPPPVDAAQQDNDTAPEAAQPDASPEPVLASEPVADGGAEPVQEPVQTAAEQEPADTLTLDLF